MADAAELRKTLAELRAKKAAEKGAKVPEATPDKLEPEKPAAPKSPRTKKAAGTTANKPPAPKPTPNPNAGGAGGTSEEDTKMATSDEMVENALIQLGQALEQQAADAEDKTKRQAAAARAAELLHQKYNGVPAVAPAAAGDTAVIAAPSGAPFQAIHRNGVVALADPATVAASKGDYLPLNEAGMVRTPQGAVSVEVVQSRLDEYFPPKRRFPIRFK